MGPGSSVDRPQAPDAPGRVLLAKRPDHIWMLDFTRVGGVVGPLWIGAVIDAFSRRVLAIGAVRGAPSSAFAVRLLRDAIRRNGVPRWLVTDEDPVLRGGFAQRLTTRHGILGRYGAVGEGANSVDRADLENVEERIRAAPLPSAFDSRTRDGTPPMGALVQHRRAPPRAGTADARRGVPRTTTTHGAERDGRQRLERRAAER